MNRIAPYSSRFAVLVFLAAASRVMAEQGSVSGRWDAVVRVGDVDVPFRFDIEGDAQAVQGSFFNGERRTRSTSGRLEGAALTLDFDQYASKLVANLQDGQIVGEYQRPRGPYPFRATRATKTAAIAKGVPRIEGTWEKDLTSTVTRLLAEDF